MNCIIITGLELIPFTLQRGAGAYRLRTELESFGYTCKVIDFYQHFEEYELQAALDRYITTETLWIGLSTTFLDIEKDLNQKKNFWNSIKKKYPHVKFILGGAKALDSNLDFVDFFVTGYADDAIVALTQNIKTFENKTIQSNKEFNKTDLSNIPVIWKKEDLIPQGSALPIEISRGCIFNCAFCAFPLNGKKKLDYIRSVDSIQREIEYNYETFGVSDYIFLDDTFNDSIYKLENLKNALDRLNFDIKYSAYIKPELLVAQPEQIDLLIETGLVGASLGIESLNPQTRQAIFKLKNPDKVLESMKLLKEKSKGKTKNAVTMIVGLPHETIETASQGADFLYNCDYIDTYMYSPLQIRYPDKNGYSSPIEKDPSKFGYLISKHLSNDFSQHWYNAHMNITKASQLATQFMNESRDRQRISAWTREGLINVNGPQEGYIKDLPLDTLTVNKERFIKEYKELLISN